MKGTQISFHFPIDWDCNDGNIIGHTTNDKRCTHTHENGNSCVSRSFDRHYCILNSIEDTFVLSVEQGIPANMWKALLNNVVICLGTHPRKVSVGIFNIHGNHFVSAYLIDNPSQAPNAHAKKWIKFETQRSQIRNLLIL